MSEENLRFKNSLEAKNFQQDAADFKRAYESEKNRADAAQLQARFARGWELFKKYQRVGSHARQLLQGVFTHDNSTKNAARKPLDLAKGMKRRKKISIKNYLLHKCSFDLATVNVEPETFN